jgi:ketosteroid isomerase-like protein
MSEEAMEAVRTSFDRASRVRDPAGREIDALDRETLAVVFDSFDPEIEVHEDPRFPEAGTYRGLEAVRGYLLQFTDSFDEFIFEVDDLVDLGADRVLVLFLLRTRGKGSGATAEARPGWIYTIRGSKTVLIEAYLDREDAFAAAGPGA